MNINIEIIRRKSPFGLATLLGVIALSSGAVAQTTRKGNPYRPAGASYQIYGDQGIDSSNLTGKSGFATQVNTDFEMTPSIGVTYQQGNKLVDFGIGLYKDASNATQSTGLTIKCDSADMAYSASVTVLDLDSKVVATGSKPTNM